MREGGNAIGCRAQKSQHENKLPGQRIEEPSALDGPCRNVDAKPKRQGINGERQREQKPSAHAINQNHEWSRRHEHDIERKNIEITELMRKQDYSRLGFDGSFTAAANGYKVYELTSFPTAKHDDQVDSTSQALAWIAEAGREPGIIVYYQKILEELRRKGELP